MVRSLFTPLLSDEPHEEGLTWLGEVLKANPNLLDNFRKDDVQTFKDRVSYALKNASNDSSSNLISRIADLLNITRTKS